MTARKFLRWLPLALLLLLGAGAGAYALHRQKSQPEPPPQLVEAQRINQLCRGQKERSPESCYNIEFKSLTLSQGADRAFQVLGELQRIDPVALGCHFIAHGIGNGAYARDPDSWRNTLNTIDPTCSYGAPMGVVESYVATLPEGSFNKVTIASFCGQPATGDCNHMIGHLAMIEARGVIPEALELCRGITEAQQLDKCYTGVFMENITATGLVDHQIVGKEYFDWQRRGPELEQLCRRHSGAEASACWKELAHVVVANNASDPTHSFAACHQAPQQEWSLRCRLHAIGMLGSDRQFNMESLAYMCDLYPGEPDFKVQCAVYAVQSALSSSPTNLEKSLRFCAALDETTISDCYSQIGNHLRVTVPGKVSELCEPVPSRYRRNCLEGGGRLGALSSFD